MTHLTQETIAGWRSRTLAPSERLATVRHLGECKECRELVNSPAGISRLEAAFGEPDGHPSYEDLEALADGKAGAAADPVAHDLISFHLANCTTCAGEYNDLVAFRASLQKKAPERRRIGWMLPAAAAVAAVALVAVIAMRTPHTTKRESSTGTQSAAQLTAALHDAGTTIGLDSTGALRGLDNIPDADRDILRQALQSQTLPLFVESGLKRATEVRLGGPPSAASGFSELSPTGTVVPEPTPRFHWNAPKGANNFIVSVYTKDFEPVMISHPLADKEWTPDKPLVDGASYVWIVSALVDGRRVTAPRAPEPEALFRVATREERQHLQAARQAVRGSDLLEAAVAAHLGMIETARQALARLEAANPGSPVVAALTRQLQPETTKTK